MRNKIIDNSRGLGIIFVVLGHNWLFMRGNEEMYRVVFSFHVPLFFFLSGVVFKSNSKFQKLIAEKFNSLLKPYLIILLLLTTYTGITTGEIPVDSIFGIAFGTGQSVAIEPIWFLPHLFVCIIFSWLLIKLLNTDKNIERTILTIILMLLVGVTGIDYWRSISLGSLNIGRSSSSKLIGLPFSIDLTLISSAYFIFGYISSAFIKEFKINYAALTIAVLIFTSSHFFFDDTINLNYRSYDSFFISTIQAICGIYLIINASYFLQKINLFEKLFSYIGAGSLFILIFHGVLQGKAISKLQSFGFFPSWLAGFLGLAGSVIFSLLLWEIAKKIPLARALLLDNRKKQLK